MPNYSLNHARSGSENLTPSTYPLLYRPRRFEPLRAYLKVIFMGFRGPEALKDNLHQRENSSVDHPSGTQANTVATEAHVAATEVKLCII